MRLNQRCVTEEKWLPLLENLKTLVVLENISVIATVIVTSKRYCLRYRYHYFENHRYTHWILLLVASDLRRSCVLAPH